MRVIRLQNIGSGRFDDTDRAFVSEEHFSGLRKHRCQPGDVLIATLGEPIIRACLQPASIEEALNKADCIQLRCDRGVALPAYIARFLNSPVGQQRVAALAHGQTRSRINLTQMKALTVPLPSIEEQRRIAAVLDQAEELRARRRGLLALVNSVPEETFVDMFGARDLPVVRIGDVGVVQGGLQVTRSREANEMDVPYLRVANVHRGRLVLHEVKVIKVTESEFIRTRLKSDDLLVVEGHGNPAEIGRVARWTGVIDPCVHQNHLIRIRLDSSRADAMFVEAFLNGRAGRRTLLRAANTTSGLNTISVRDVRGVGIALPPLVEQKQFASCVRATSDVEARAEAHLAELGELFASLQHRAFRGEL